VLPSSRVGAQNALVAVTLLTPSTQPVKVNHSTTAGSDDQDVSGKIREWNNPKKAI